MIVLRTPQLPTHSTTVATKSRKTMPHSLKRSSYQIKKKTMLTKFKKPKRRIQFDTESYVPPVHSSEPEQATGEELRTRWYSKQELQDFKKEAVKLTMLTNQMYGPNVFPRGMEACTDERLRHKSNTLKCVLVAYKKGKSPEYVAELYRQCTDWNRDVAFQQACRDYFEIYHPAMAEQIPIQNTKPPKITLVKKPKPVESRTTSPVIGAVSTGKRATSPVAMPVIPTKFTKMEEVAASQRQHRMRLLARRHLG